MQIVINQNSDLSIIILVSEWLKTVVEQTLSSQSQKIWLHLDVDLGLIILTIIEFYNMVVI